MIKTVYTIESTLTGSYKQYGISERRANLIYGIISKILGLFCERKTIGLVAERV